METIKLTILPALAAVVCLTMLPTAEINTPEPTDSDGKTVLTSVQIDRERPAIDTAGMASGKWPSFSVSTPSYEGSAVQAGGSGGLNGKFILYPELKRIERLADRPGYEALFELETLSDHADPVIRLAAIEAISEMKIEEIPLSIMRALDDRNPLVRIAALETLAWREDPALTHLVEPMLFDPERKVRLAAIDALAQLKGPQAVIALTGLMTDRDVGLRRLTINALGEIGGETAIHLLRQARFDVDRLVRANAEAILHELGAD